MLSCGLLCIAPSSTYATPNAWPPATEIPMPPGTARDGAVVTCTAAPAIATNSTAFRPLSGSARISLFCTTSLIPELWTSTSGAAPSTVTDSASVPTPSTGLITSAAPTCITIPVCTYVRKPCSIASMRYGPTGRFVRTYDPLSLVTSLRVNPVSVCVTVTVTPGSTAPLSSVTRPLSCAVESCADAEVVMSSSVRAPTSGVRNRCMTYSSPVGRWTYGRNRRRYYQRSDAANLSCLCPTRRWRVAAFLLGSAVTLG